MTGQVPSFRGEQPGETYYYSPLNINVEGVVDLCDETPKMRAFCWHEGEGGRGGNNIASVVIRDLEMDGLIPDENPPTSHEPVKELCFAFDNCAGQNKNRQVMRLLVWLVKKKVCVKATALFLVRGHTKNECDRLFNLVKIEYRKSNIYLMEDLLESYGKHQDITAVEMTGDDFNNWDELENQVMSRVAGVSTHHLFQCDATRNSDGLYMRLYDGQEEKFVPLVFEEFRQETGSD